MRAWSKAVIAVMLAGCVFAATSWASPPAPYPRHVLLTNDDGVAEASLRALAGGFAKTTRTTVVAPLADRSGTSHTISALRPPYALSVERRGRELGATWFAVDGYPGDCVLLALRGLLEEPPDLVVSGVNGGPNLGFDWLASGTIGAARVAALWGVPAIAVSGLDPELPGALEAAVEWVLRLSSASLVQNLDGGRYLTVSIPRVAPHEVKGVRVATRAGILLDFAFSPASPAGESGGHETWQLLPPRPRTDATSGSDAALYAAGWIVVVPMRASEDDLETLAAIRGGQWSLPAWRGAPQ